MNAHHVHSTQDQMFPNGSDRQRHVHVMQVQRQKKEQKDKERLPMHARSLDSVASHPVNRVRPQIVRPVG